MGYSRDGAPSIYPCDQTLALPARSFSYELQRRLVKATVQNPFHESVEAIADLTGVAVFERSLERSYAMPPRILTPSSEARPRTGQRLHPGGGGRWQGNSPGASPSAHHPQRGGPKGRRSTRSEWLRSLPSSAARLGCDFHNRSTKACSPPAAGLSMIHLLPSQRTNGCGRVCARGRPPSFRR
jgi:hypothetical protein